MGSDDAVFDSAPSRTSLKEKVREFQSHTGSSSRQSSPPPAASDNRRDRRDSTDIPRVDPTTYFRLPDVMVCDTTDSLHAFSNDGTGSARSWQADIAGKAWYFIPASKMDYYGPGSQFVFGTFGDPHEPGPDKYAVKFRNPVTDADAAFQVQMDLKTEYNGGGQLKESSELVMLYVWKQIKAENARHKVLVILTDEAPWPIAEKRFADPLGIRTDGDVYTSDIIKGLKKAGWEIFVILKPYGEETSFSSYYSSRIYEAWRQYLPANRIIRLRDSTRVTDINLAIAATVTGRVDYFYEDLLAKQHDPTGRLEIEKIVPVYEALRDVHGVEVQERHPYPGMKMSGLGEGQPSESLL